MTWCRRGGCQCRACPAQGQGSALVPGILLSAFQPGCYSMYLHIMLADQVSAPPRIQTHDANSNCGMLKKYNTLFEVHGVEVCYFYTLINNIYNQFKEKKKALHSPSTCCLPLHQLVISYIPQNAFSSDLQTKSMNISGLFSLFTADFD